MTDHERKIIYEMSQGRGVPGKCSMCFIEGAEAAFKIAEEKEKKLVEALEKNKSEWEILSPTGSNHLVAWQMCRDAIAKYRAEKGEL